MQTSLVKLATLAALIHMALGCAWHHGFGSPHACQSSCHQSPDQTQPTHDCDSISNSDGRATFCCNHDRLGSSKATRNVPPSDSFLLQEGRAPQHPICDDDRCFYTTADDFDGDVFYGFPLPWFVSAAMQLDTHLAMAMPPPNADHAFLGGVPGLRAHLALGVQLV